MWKELNGFWDTSWKDLYGDFLFFIDHSLRWIHIQESARLRYDFGLNVQVGFIVCFLYLVHFKWTETSLLLGSPSERLLWMCPLVHGCWQTMFFFSFCNETFSEAVVYINMDQSPGFGLICPLQKQCQIWARCYKMFPQTTLQCTTTNTIRKSNFWGMKSKHVISSECSIVVTFALFLNFCFLTFPF